MKKADGQPAGKSGSPTKDERATRLAEALRANLHRRKAQARAAAESPAAVKKSDQ